MEMNLNLAERGTLALNSDIINHEAACRSEIGKYMIPSRTKFRVFPLYRSTFAIQEYPVDGATISRQTTTPVAFYTKQSYCTIYVFAC